MPVQLSVDRFEGRDDEIAVLVSDDGASADVPRAWLPGSVKPGDVLALDVRIDADAARKLADETRKVQDELKETDPGGDLSL